MWVEGDLKQRLGLGARDKEGSRLENASLFRKTHPSNESEMELNVRGGGYEPANVTSPPVDWETSKEQATPNDYPLQPPMTHSRDELRSASPDYRYSYYSSNDIPSSTPTPISRTPTAPLTPQPAHLDPTAYESRSPGHSAESSQHSRYATADSGDGYEEEVPRAL